MNINMNSKRIYFGTAIIFLLFISPLFAQENDEPQYLFDLKTVKLSGFGSTITELSSLDGGFGVSSGGGGAILFNYNSYIGFYGTSLESNHYREDIYPIDHNPISNPQLPRYTDLQLWFENNGVWFGYINNYKKLVHWGANMKIGHGVIGLYDKDIKFDNRDVLFKDNVFVASPEFEVEFNIARWFKVNMGVGYRIVTGFDNKYFTNVDGEQKILFKRSQFNSPYANVKLMFGRFAKRERGRKINEIKD